MRKIMLLNQRVGISFFKGDSHDAKFDVYWSMGDIFTLSGWRARLKVGDEIVKDSANPGEATLVGNVVTFLLKPADSVMWANRVTFDAEIYRDNDSYTFAYGVINFLRVDSSEIKRVRLYRDDTLDVECWGNWQNGTSINLEDWAIRFRVGGEIIKDSVNAGEVTVIGQTNHCLVHLKPADSVDWVNAVGWQCQVYDATDTYTFDSGRIKIRGD